MLRAFGAQLLFGVDATQLASHLSPPARTSTSTGGASTGTSTGIASGGDGSFDEIFFNFPQCGQAFPGEFLLPPRKGTRVLISLWYSLMFGRVPGTRPNISESHSEISTRVPFCIAQAGAEMVWGREAKTTYDEPGAGLTRRTAYSSTHLATMGFANVRAGTWYPPEH